MEGKCPGCGSDFDHDNISGKCIDKGGKRYKCGAKNYQEGYYPKSQDAEVVPTLECKDRQLAAKDRALTLAGKHIYEFTGECPLGANAIGAKAACGCSDDCVGLHESIPNCWKLYFESEAKK